MSKEEYIKAIKHELGFLSPYERSCAASYFESYFTGNQDAEDVISCLGDAKTAAGNYYRVLYSSSKEKKFKIPSWAAALAAIILFPAALTVGLAAALIVTALVFAASLLFIGIAAVCTGMWFEGLRIVITSLGMHIILADKLILLGLGFLIFAAGIVLTWLVAKWYIKMFPKLFRFIIKSGSRLIDRCGKD